LLVDVVIVHVPLMQAKVDVGDGKRITDGMLLVKIASKIRKQNARATSRKGGAKAPPFLYQEY
jgi:hypothetical protein